MHRAAFASLGLEATYDLFPAGAEALPTVLAALEATGPGSLAGANVTTPLKALVAGHVNCRGHARRAQAVNTVVAARAGWVGVLTDVEGVSEPLTEVGYGGGGSAVVLGAGGAARAAVLALELLGADNIAILARDVGKAAEVGKTLAPRMPCEAIALGDLSAVRRVFAGARVIVQATVVGRNHDALPLPWEAFQTGTLAFEMISTPRQTPFLTAAAAAGGVPIEGWRMLLAQGARSFELWTGNPAPREVMKVALLDYFGGLPPLSPPLA